MLNFEVPDLYVKDYDNAFPGKQEALLNALKSAEKDHGKDIPIKVDTTRRTGKRRISTKSFRNQQSIFKVPEVPFKIGNIRRTALKSAVRRGNWIKYDLSDVSADDMTEGANARAAFSFLKELEDRKRRNDDSDDIVAQNFKPVFNKRSLESSNSERRINIQSTKQQHSSINVQNPLLKITQRKISVSNVIKLNHLDFEEDAE